ncbi:MAG TPA: DUF2188 domain-containing protein [Longimicrobiales bacterium]|nr:DUF2188 domain-containing protein [Longimicrobiales bacterium]
MARIISRRLAKRVRRGAKAVANSRATTKIAGVAGAMASAAGIAAAMRYLRRGSPNGATLHVVPNGDGWAITSGDSSEPIKTFATKKEAVDAGRAAAAKSAPSDLVIHRSDGSVQIQHTYEA